MSLSPEELSLLVAEYNDLDAHRADLTERCEQIKETIRNGVPHHGKHETGAGPVTVTPTRKWDADLAAEVIPDALLPAVQKVIPAKTVIDQSLCKEHLSKGLYRKCTTEGGKATVRFG